MGFNSQLLRLLSSVSSRKADVNFLVNSIIAFETWLPLGTLLNIFGALWYLHRISSAHQRNQPAPAGDFEFAEDRVNVLFHRR
jgi:hypothetical protein